MDWSRILEVLMVVLFTSSGQLLLRLGMRDLEQTGQGVGELIGHILRTPTLLLGLGLYGVSTLLWLRVLGRNPVSSVYPMVALGYVFVTIGGVVFLREQVSLQGWIALGVISAGVLLLAITPVQPAS